MAFVIPAMREVAVFVAAGIWLMHRRDVTS